MDLDIPDFAKCDFPELTIMKFYLTIDLTNQKCFQTGTGRFSKLFFSDNFGVQGAPHLFSAGKLNT